MRAVFFEDAERQKTNALRPVNGRNEIRSRQVFPMRRKFGLSPRQWSPDHGGDQGASQCAAPQNPHIPSAKRPVIANQGCTSYIRAASRNCVLRSIVSIFGSSSYF